ncbi:MAG TPA: SDR family NAD(P)-dependent oxidoreductase [Saprospiraceae bacterium]|nr:SDR family NAD(P)-dependent oxidoreductase [Saprospiraceae bacterium]
MKTVLITGASSGIGRAIAKAFAAYPEYQLILCARRKEKLEALAQQLPHTKIHLLTFDVRDFQECKSAISSLPDSFGKVDILINNAGLALGLDPIQEGNVDHWETMIDTNVKGLLYMTKIVSPIMIAQKSGHIINICSTAGKEVYPKGNVYCASKFAVDALTKSIRQDLFAHNIRVSQVAPGHVEETEFAINRFEGDSIKANIYSDFNALKPDDVADAVYFLATRPAHVNIQDILMMSTQQASSTIVDRTGRRFD